MSYKNIDSLKMNLCCNIDLIRYIVISKNKNSYVRMWDMLLATYCMMIQPFLECIYTFCFYQLIVELDFHVYYISEVRPVVIQLLHMR